MKNKKRKVKIVEIKEGYLDVWSLIKCMNTAHPDFGTVVRFLNPEKTNWFVKLK